MTYHVTTMLETRSRDTGGRVMTPTASARRGVPGFMLLRIVADNCPGPTRLSSRRRRSRVGPSPRIRGGCRDYRVPRPSRARAGAPGDLRDVELSPVRAVQQRGHEMGVPATAEQMTATAGQRMRAIVQTEYGTADVLRVAEIERPVIGAEEVLVKVRAAGLDRGTWHLMAGMPYAARLVVGLRAPKNPVPGLDVAGVVG